MIIRIISASKVRIGQAFEHFIAMELRAYLSYSRQHVPLEYWRSKHGHEVDFIVGEAITIEVKSTMHVVDKHLKGLKVLQEENLLKKYFLISLDRVARVSNGIEILHWEAFLQALWAGEIL